MYTVTGGDKIEREGTHPLFTPSAQRQTHSHSIDMLYADSRGALLPCSRSLFLQYAAVFRQHQTARTVHRFRAAPDRYNSRIYHCPLDSGRSPDLSVCIQAIRDSSRKNRNSHSADRCSYQQRICPQEHFSPYMDKSSRTVSNSSGGILRNSCIPPFYRAQQHTGRPVSHSSRVHAHRSIGVSVAFTETQPYRSPVSARTFAGEEHFPHNSRLDKTHARQKNACCKTVSRVSSGNARHRDISICARRSADLVRTQHRHFHQRGGIP